MNAMTETKPMFEVGKTYKTRDGRIAKIETLARCGHFSVGGYVDGHWQCWTIDGKWTDTYHALDLMPGAIEDEKAKPAPSEVEQLETRIVLLANYARNLEERIGKLETSAVCDPIITADMAAKIEEHDKRFNGVRNDLTRHEGFAKNHGEQLDTHTKQITELDQHALKAQCNGHQFLSDRLDALEQQMAAAAKPNGGLFDCLLTHELMTAKPHGPGLSPPPKPTIKGGWVNVYRGKRKPRVGDLHFNRQEAEDAAKGDDARIACIQIPDFVEGEGL